MYRRNGAIFIIFAALVAGAALVVYAQQDPSPPSGASAGGTPEAAKEKTAPEPLKEDSVPATNRPAPAQTPPASAGGKGVIYDPTTLPDPVQRMLGEIGNAAQSGDIERMRSVLETNELKPMVASAHVDDPIAHWKKDSADGDGRDVLAAMLNILSAGGVLAGKDKIQIYVWPYFAEMDLKTLTPAQEVEFYRAVPPDVGVAMKKSGKYNYYRLGISPAGVWHYFLQ